MLCISVTPESRQLAKVDILNASRHGDLIEVCLDKLIKTPDIGELLSGFDKPILISCRRERDGGHWAGSEEDRLQLFRNAIAANPAYIELELDIADRIPRFGETKRVISVNSIDRPLGNVDDVFTKAKHHRADVVKFTWPTRTLDEAWPLLAAVSQKRELPVVGMGLGDSSVTFSLLGRKFGSPWIYAALEKGMEAHPGQKTVWELNDSYGWTDINPTTRFVGVVGMGETEIASIRVLNAAFRKFGADVRCLPLRIGKLKHVNKMLSALKVRGMLVGSANVDSVYSLIDNHHRGVADGKFADLLLRRDSLWHGHNTLRKAIQAALTASGKDIARRRVMVIGANSVARSILPILTEAEAAVSIATPDDKSATAMASQYDASVIPWSAIYDTVTDFLVFTDAGIPVSQAQSRGLNPSILREHMTVLDVSRYPDASSLAEEARERGCTVVEPTEIYIQQLSTQFRAITGKELPVEAFRDGLIDD
ncbi:MAG: type I 3-dehydroquinate dehydratase [Planctomycetaceae bacterium]